MPADLEARVKQLEAKVQEMTDRNDGAPEASAEDKKKLAAMVEAAARAAQVSEARLNQKRPASRSGPGSPGSSSSVTTT